MSVGSLDPFEVSHRPQISIRFERRSHQLIYIKYFNWSSVQALNWCNASRVARLGADDRQDPISSKPRNRPGVLNARRLEGIQLSLRAGMGRRVDLQQALGVDIGVALGRRQGSVAQQLLDRSQIAAGGQKMGGE